MKFRTKPCEIEAVQWMGSNYIEVAAFMGGKLVVQQPATGRIYIDTLEGRMYANAGDWIVKGLKGEFYPCKPDIFAMKYERVLDDEGGA